MQSNPQVAVLFPLTVMLGGLTRVNKGAPLRVALLIALLYSGIFDWSSADALPRKEILSPLEKVNEVRVSSGGSSSEAIFQQSSAANLRSTCSCRTRTRSFICRAFV